MSITKLLFAFTTIAVALLIPTLALADGNLPPLPTLTGQWWQWAYSLPPSQNPLNDPTGAQCMFGQRGGIWFLAGNQQKNTPRTCSVPEGATPQPGATTPPTGAAPSPVPTAPSGAVATPAAPPPGSPR